MKKVHGVIGYVVLFVIQLMVISIPSTCMWFTCGIFLVMIVLAGGCHFIFCGFFFFGWLIIGMIRWLFIYNMQRLLSE
jgi:hypothetical protein